MPVRLLSITALFCLLTLPPLPVGARSLAGLWVGTARLDAVSEAEGPDPSTLTPAATFEFPLLIHVDHSGAARLLREVVMLWDDGTNPPAYRLYSDPDALPTVTAEARRISSAAFDFPGESVALDGEFSPGGALSGLIQLPADFPTNPFRHRYHPDHDEPAESFAIQRRLRLEFSASGDDTGVLEGLYRESLSGLHRQEIRVGGSFTLERISHTPILNP